MGIQKKATFGRSILGNLNRFTFCDKMSRLILLAVSENSDFNGYLPENGIFFYGKTVKKISAHFLFGVFLR